MAAVSAGLLLFRRPGPAALEVLIAHPGGPFFRRRDDGAWTIPKGLIEPGESPEAAARREFFEETGFEGPARLLELTPVRLKSGKRVYAFAGEGDADPDRLSSNVFQLEWPRGSGQLQSFPEIDRVAFVVPDEARRRLNPAQTPLIDELERLLARDPLSRVDS